MQRGSTLEQVHTGKALQRATIEQILKALGGIILGKDAQIRLALACLLAKGHLLIEDLPGLGKTMLAQGLARVLGLSFQRIQFTSDLLPADIVGVSVFRQDRNEFEFQPDLCSRSSFSRTRSIGQRRRRKVHCSKRWKNSRYRWTVRRAG